MMKTATKLLIATAGAVSALGFEVPAAHAFGDAPWCAVIEIGSGEIYWDCQYRTVEQCVPHVLAGNRGFCNLNPYGPGPSAPVAVHQRRHKHSAQH
jgi:hypothetical protein